MIPKVIHYCWFGGKPLPSSVKKCIKSWKKYCPDYEIKQWNESNFDVNCHPFVQSAYKEKAWAFVSDYARLKVVYENGGIYFDTDVELLKSPDQLLENECYIGVQQDGRFCTTGLGFGAVRHSSVVGEMLRQYDGLVYSPEKKASLACPYLNARVFEALGYRYSEEIRQCEGVTVYPSRYFDPIAPGNTKNLLCADTVSIHHYSASWTNPRQRLKRKLIILIGEERMHRLKKLIKKQ